MKSNKNDLILVTGATGYVGGRLIPRLLSDGYRLKATARSLVKLRGRSWSDHPRLELEQANLHDPASVNRVLKGCRTAYYLVHSMTPEQKNFVQADRQAAVNFVRAANESDLKRIVYLGGLGGDKKEASPHLKSRLEVARILGSGSVPATIFRSAHILGSGSASFEILRYLSERLPVIMIPRIILDTRVQPICIRNVLHYLALCLEKEETIGETFEIGGPDVHTYRMLFKIYAREAGIRSPLFISSMVPFSKTGLQLGKFLAKLVLPVPPSIAEPLLSGATNHVVAKEDRITRIIPQKLMTCRESIARAIQKESQQIVETSWTDAGELKPPEWAHRGDAPYSGGTLLTGGFKLVLSATPEEIWPTISRVGGATGWYYGDFLWQLRGWMDSFVGGVGLRRGRRHPENLFIGDALDFWRVLHVLPPHRLVLVAEMKLPGEAILDFDIIEAQPGQTELRLCTRFRPRGLYGELYWYSLLPPHDLLFGGMLKEVARQVGRKVLSGPKKFKPEPISWG